VSNLFSEPTIFNYVKILFLLAFLLPLSLVLLSRPFLTKMVVKPEGIEYHSTFFVLQADWKNLANLGYARKTHAGDTLVIVPRAGILIHKKWARPFRNLLAEYPNDLGDVEILVSQFSEHKGHSFETDVLANVEPQIGSEEIVESLRS
jgi:hypothetical protein